MLVSVVMATYNRSEELQATIANILLQSHRPIQVVVVNDGSIDNTSEQLENLQALYPIVVIENKVNLGLQASLNIGVRASTGDFIARIDDHDKWTDSDKLAKQVTFLRENKEVGIVGTGYIYGGQQMSNPLSDADIRSQILMRSPFCHVSIMMRKSVFDAVGGYDESLQYSEDWDLWLKIGKVSQMANLPDFTTDIEGSDFSLSSQYFLKQLPINRIITKRYSTFYPNRWKAALYHRYIAIFFSLFSVGGVMHLIMQKIFLSSFSLTIQEKKSE